MNDPESTKRRDWQAMQQKISSAYVQLYRDAQKAPTNADLAKKIGVSERTISRHLKQIDFSILFSEQREAFAPLMGNVMMSIYNSAMKGSTRAQKLMLEIVFEWAEPKSFEQPVTDKLELTNEEIENMERGIELLVEMELRNRGRKAQNGIIDIENKTKNGV